MPPVSEKHFTRAAYVRALVESAVKTLSAGDLDRGIWEFERVCVSEGKRLGLRVWKGEGRSSIRRLLKMRKSLGSLKNGSPRKVLTGSNTNWVMDLMEAGARRVIYGQAPLQVIEEAPVMPPPRRNGIVASRLQELKPLSMRILEAYLQHDDQAIVDISEELESRGL